MHANSPTLEHVDTLITFLVVIYTHLVHTHLSVCVRLLHRRIVLNAMRFEAHESATTRCAVAVL